MARGATLTDDMETYLSSVIFIEFGNWEAVRYFIDNEPLKKNGVYKEVRICRWHKGLERCQVNFPREEGQSYWYIRGVGRPNASSRRNELLEAHRAYFAAYDGKNFFTRGAVLDDEGEKWVGSANLIALPSRTQVDTFMAEEPFYMSGLYDRVLIERFKFGGRANQIV